MNSRTQTTWRIGAIAAALSAAFIARPLAAQTAATQPAMSDEQLMNDVRQLIQQLGPIIGSASRLSDPAIRQSVAPQGIPLLKHIVADIDQISAIPAPAKTQIELQYLPLLSVLGDHDATNTMSSLASSTDPTTAMEGQSAQLFAQWLLAGKDADAQTKVADQIEPLDKAHPESNELTQYTYLFSRNAATPELHDRLAAMVEGMKSPAAGEIKQMNDAAAKLASLENKPLVVSGTLVTGTPFSTSAWKGKVVLVDFWATWCGPCREELPRVKKIYGDYHAKGLEVLGVSNDYSAATLTDFTVQNEMPWPELLDVDAASQQKWNPITLGYGIYGIPTMFLIDKNGVLRTTDARDNMETMIPQLLAE
ncbi:MAG TPA: TlpA disulfide reductase family protein [Tepidisphaeraceae bacterium]|nr:TlpA disulfide reductase family protein [Tepidisphaeraceae bacterium]